MLDFNKDEKIDLKVLGTKVLLKKCVKTLNKKYGNIILPHDVDKNSSLGVAIIGDLGSEAKKQTQLNVGDYVLYDYYSVFENNDVYVITNAENIIVRLTKEEADNYINNYVLY